MRRYFLRKMRLLYGIIAFSLIIPLLYFTYEHNLIDYLRTESFSKFSYPLETNFTILLNYLKKEQSVGYEPINKFVIPPILEDDKKCKTMDGDDEPIWILMVIKSAIGNLEIRNAIRQTWGDEFQFAALPMRRIFMLGIRSKDLLLQRQVGIESNQYGDIVQYYFEDIMFNNTCKFMAGLKWMKTNCRGIQYIMFVDDDFYVNMHVLRILLNKPLRGSIIGYIWNNTMPLRRRSSRWKISVEEYPYRYWPPFPCSGFILMEYKTANDFYLAMEYVKYIRFDDVFIGIIAYKLKIPLIHDERILPEPIVYSDEKFEKAIAIHGVKKIDVLIKIWKRQNKIFKQRLKTKRKW